MDDKKYLIAVDLDGTILPDYSTIYEKLVKVINVLKNKGHKFVIVTGRPFRSSVFVHKAFGLDTPLVNFNGCRICYPSEYESPLLNETVELEDLLNVYNTCRQYINNIFCEVNDNIFLMKEEEKIVPLLHYNELATLTIGDLNDILKDNINGCLLTSDKENAEKIKKYVLDNYQGRMGARIWSWLGLYTDIVELYPVKENKGSALKFVADKLGFKQEDVIAIGDSHNDIEMIEYAGIGVAMANADNYLKSIANIVTNKTCKEVGVYDFLCEYFNLDKETLEDK